MNVDYKEILKKYMEAVYDEFSYTPVPETFTEKELSAFSEIDMEIYTGNKGK